MEPAAATRNRHDTGGSYLSLMLLAAAITRSKEPLIAEVCKNTAAHHEKLTARSPLVRTRAQAGAWTRGGGPDPGAITAAREAARTTEGPGGHGGGYARLTARYNLALEIDCTVGSHHRQARPSKPGRRRCCRG